MKQRNFMVALDILDTALGQKTELTVVPVIKPEKEDERDTEAEIAAFVNRPLHKGQLQASKRLSFSKDVDVGTGKKPFSEAAGFSRSSL